MEDFFPIPDYDGYFINRNGEILSKKRYKDSIMKPKMEKHGYYRICLLNKDNKRKFLLVHRLLALTFISNDNNLPHVDHIDRCKTNNSISNLRWASKELNNQNRTRPKNNKLGHKNITLYIDKRNGKEYSYYIFIINRNKKTHQKYFKTLEEAISYRDEYIINLGEEIID